MNKNGSKWIRPERRLAIYIRDAFECLYCGRDLRTAGKAEVTLDHLLPRSAGGLNVSDNLVTACRTCNSTRQDKPWADYATGGAQDRINHRRHEALNIDLAKALIEGSAGDLALENAR